MDPSLPQVAAFIRQYAHDLRNDLTGIELEAVLLASICPDGEATEIVGRLRAQTHSMAANLQNLAARFVEPKPVRTPLRAREFFQMLEKQTEPGQPELVWTESLGDASVSADAVSLIGVFRELFANAVKFGDESRLTLTAAVEAGNAMFSLREPKADPVNPEAWGRVPFVSITRGSYGLGLWEADRVVRANGGSVVRAFKDGSLVTTLSFPLE